MVCFTELSRPICWTRTWKTLTAMAMLGSGTNEQLQSIGVEPALVPSISRVLPLVTITEAPELGFRVHDILRASVLELTSTCGYRHELAPRVVDQLLRRGEMIKALDLVSQLYEGDALSEWLEANGQTALGEGYAPQVKRMLSRLALRELIERPRFCCCRRP